MSKSNGWQRAKIGDFCEVTSSKRTYAKDIVDQGVPFYRSKEVIELFNGQREFSHPLFITEERYEGIKKKFGVPQIGDVMITSRGTLGIPLVVKDRRPFYFADGNLSWFKNLDGVDPFLLYYWLLSPRGKAQLQKCTIGSSQQAYTIVQLKEMEIQLPSLPTQHKIASILSAYDDLIENNTRRIAILEEMAQAIYREWFVNFRFPGHENVKLVDSPLGMIPEGWEHKHLHKIANTRLGKMLDAQKNKGDLMPYLANINVRWSEFDLQNLREMRFEADEREKYGLRYGDIVMCEGGEPGRCAVWTEQVPNMMIQKAIHRIRSHEDIPFRYLFHSLWHKGRTGHLESLFTGATIKHLPGEKLKTVMVEVPAKNLMDSFSKMVEPMARQVEVLTKRNAILRSTRDLLLPKLISGKLDVEDLDIDTGLAAEALAEATA